MSFRDTVPLVIQNTGKEGKRTGGNWTEDFLVFILLLKSICVAKLAPNNWFKKLSNLKVTADTFWTGFEDFLSSFLDKSGHIANDSVSLLSSWGCNVSQNPKATCGATSTVWLDLNLHLWSEYSNVSMSSEAVLRVLKYSFHTASTTKKILPLPE